MKVITILFIVLYSTSSAKVNMFESYNFDSLSYFFIKSQMNFCCGIHQLHVLLPTLQYPITRAMLKLTVELLQRSIS